MDNSLTQIEKQMYNKFFLRQKLGIVSRLTRLEQEQVLNGAQHDGKEYSDISQSI